jgi:hypothetical protein
MAALGAMSFSSYWRLFCGYGNLPDYSVVQISPSRTKASNSFR